MKKMTVPPNTVSYIQRHIDVVNAKKDSIGGTPNTTKANLQGLELSIQNRYLDFERSFNTRSLFSFPPHLGLSAHKDDLLSCYIGRTKKVKEIFSLIENSQPANFLTRCPYCGITLPKTYDHYLPESIYPELSVHALNLIPCCNTCNQIKNDFWKNDTHRLFLHFYMDDVPNIQFLDVRLIPNANMHAVGATFTISRPPNITNNTWNVLDAHYNRLGLIQKYNEQANNEISVVFNSCVSHLRYGGVWVDRFIRDLLRSDEQLYGLNHWRVVLMKELANSIVFTNAVRTSV